MVFEAYQQNLRFAVESSFGVPVANPNLTIGVVTDGAIAEEAKVNKIVGPGQHWIYDQSYGRTQCGGRIRFIPQNLNRLNWCWGRDSSGGELSSVTISAGVYSANPSQNPVKYVGSKCQSLAFNFRVDQPVDAELEWYSQYVTTGGSFLAAPIGVELWMCHNIEVIYNGEELFNLQDMRIEVTNNLDRKYLANRQITNPRIPAYLDEGVQEIIGRIQTWDALSAGVRERAVIHDEAGFTVTVNLYDACNLNTGQIVLSGCSIPSKIETIKANDYVMFGSDVIAKSISIGST